MVHVQNGVFEEIWAKFPPYDDLDDFVKDTYPFRVRCAVIKACPPRHERFEYVRDMGMALIDKVFNGEPLRLTRLTFIFPERWMSVHEQQAFMLRLSKHPDAEQLETVDIMTSSPLIISDFFASNIQIVMFEGDEERMKSIQG